MIKFMKIALFLICLMFGYHSNCFANEQEDRLALAQKKLEEATREYAELSSELGGDNAKHFVRSFSFSKDNSLGKNKARLGINIGATKVITDENGKRTFATGREDGVEVLGITPDGPAAQAGLQAGDVITSLNGQVLLDDGNTTAIKQLTDIMAGVEPGDAIEVMYQRDGVMQSVSLVSDTMPNASFKMLLGDKALNFDGMGDFDIDIRGLDGLEGLEGIEALSNLDGLNKLEELKVFEDLGEAFGDSKFIFISKSPLGDAELVELSPELGDYFGAKSGLLVVKAPSSDAIDLRDGDVIRSIDSRVPSSVSHAMRIMRSYESGEEVKMEILRKKRKRKLNITIPENSHSKSESFQWSFDKNSNGDFPQKIKKRIKVIKDQEST